MPVIRIEGDERMNRLNDILNKQLQIRDFSGPTSIYADRQDYKRWDAMARETYRIIAAIRRPWDVSA
jgi:hypothetical protein